MISITKQLISLQKINVLARGRIDPRVAVDGEADLDGQLEASKFDENKRTLITTAIRKEI